MLCVELVSKAKVRAQHHLMVSVVARELVDALPLVLIWVTTHISLWAPATHQHRLVITIVEFSLICWRGPESIVSGVVRVSLSKCVSARNRSDCFPYLPSTELGLEDMIGEDFF